MPDRPFTVDGARLIAPSAPRGLHIVATPIGNLGDITLRALKTLAGADRVAAEDTRHTGRLLSHFAIDVPQIRYDEHRAPAQRPKILEILEEGASVALVSDAGTPLISDPGFRLVREARERGIAVHTVPGPSAVIAALSVAGLATDAFLFAGFLPAKARARQARIEELRAVRATLAFYEAPHRLTATLQNLRDGLGDRQAAVARELTKRFETVEVGSLDNLGERFGAEIKGEIVILVAPPDPDATSDEDAEALLAEVLTRLQPSAAAAEVARRTGQNRSKLYRMAMALKAHSK